VSTVSDAVRQPLKDGGVIVFKVGQYKITTASSCSLSDLLYADWAVMRRCTCCLVTENTVR